MAPSDRFKSPMTRRQLLKAASISVAGLTLPLLAACGPAAPAPTQAPAPTAPAAPAPTKPPAPTQAPAPTAAPAATPAPAATQAPAATTAPAPAGAALPADAAPKEQQVFRYAGIEGKHFDATKNIYESNGMEGYAWEPLVWVDADFNVYPGGADKWEVSKDGLTWTFSLRKTAKWSDGTPVKADDWVFSLRRMLSAKLANPYGWFYYDIKNAEAISTGKEPDTTKLGVAKVDDYTLTITTEKPVPYFLQIVGFIATIVPKHMVDKYGDDWAAKAETALSNGPYMVKEWNKGKNVVYALNPQYDGPQKGKVERIIQILVPQAGAPYLQMYQANEIDYTAVSGADLPQAMNNPDLKKDLETYPAFITYYMHFNVTKPPFDNLKVRQAFSHAIDRDAVAKSVMQGLDDSTYTMMPAGFPCSQATDPAIQKIQAYNPELAKKLLADAGFPNGQGFPALEMWTRQGQIVRESEAIQRMLKEVLNVNVTPKDVERSLYMDRLRKHDITLGLIQWAQDYSDPTNFLDWWAAQSRHPWKNEQFNQLIKDARGELDQAKRCKMYNDAEKILIEDVGGVFLFNPLNAELWKPTIAGVRKNKNGVRVHYQKFWSDVYIKKR